LTDILAVEPEQLEILRMRARLAGWKRDEGAIYGSLVELAEVAKRKESVDDERLALTQLTMIAPHDSEYADRLREINEKFGFADVDLAENGFDAQFLTSRAKKAQPDIETFAPTSGEEFGYESSVAAADFGEFAIVGATPMPDVASPVSEFTEAADDD